MEYINDPETVSKAAKGDQSAMDKIISTNLGLVKSISARFASRGVEAEDLIQIGTIGMIKAVKRFDPERSTKFSTYAVPMIIGEIRKFLRDDGLIKVSRTAKTNAARIASFSRNYSDKNGYAPDLKTVCRDTGISFEDAILAMESCAPVASLDSQNDPDSPALSEFIGDDGMEDRIETMALRDAVKSLGEDDRRLIELRFFRGLTQSQTGKILGMTQVKICRTEKRILAELKKQLE